MCGIAGFIGFADKVQLAKHSNTVQQHRGPDNHSIWSDNYIALSHQRLSIIDLSSNANQPFEKHNLVIVFNGEIYNYKELKKSIQQQKSAKFCTSSDTEVIIEYYYHYGIKCLEYFEGMFAFAIYDKEKQELFVARDHFGIKPLFYTQIGGNLAFASELKTLVGVPGFNKAINYKSLVSSLNYLWISGNETMFQDCNKLPPAHYMTISRDRGHEIKRYWSLPGSSDDTQSEEEATGKLSEILQKSIESHMVADVPVSSFLSGGIDSSLISVMAKKHVDRLSTYTITTSARDKKIEKMPDDAIFAREIAAAHNFEYNEILLKPEIVKLLPMIVRMLDEPIGDPAAINTYLMCVAAREKGIKVLLSGMGADEIFFGYTRHRATMLAQKYKKVPYIFRRLIDNMIHHLPVRLFGQGFKLARWAKRFNTFSSLPIERAYMRSYSYYERDELSELLNYNYSHEIDQIYQEHEAIYNQAYDGDSVNQICNTDINMFMVGLNLTYSDRASMAASVELRVPFIDKNVISYAMSIPGRLKFKNNETKYILKKVAQNYLPKKIIYRKKAAFGAPIRSWISNDLRPLIDNLLSKKSIHKRGIFNYDFVKKIIDSDREGLEDNAYRIYQLLTIELWFREFVDK